MVKSGFMGIDSNNGLHFTAFQVSPFAKFNLFIGELFRHFWIYGFDFQNIFWIYGYTFQKFLRIFGWYFHDLNGTNPVSWKINCPLPPCPLPRVDCRFDFQAFWNCSVPAKTLSDNASTRSFKSIQAFMRVSTVFLLSIQR